MKKLLILLLALIPYLVNAQLGRVILSDARTEAVVQNTLDVLLTLNFPLRDTNFIAATFGNIVRRPADSLLYVSNGVQTAGVRHWNLLGSTGGSSGAVWGVNITGNISAQADLQTEFNTKQNVLPIGLGTQYWDATGALRTFPTIPGQLNPTSPNGTVVIAGTYPNLTFISGITNNNQLTNGSGFLTANQPISISGDGTAGPSPTSLNLVLASVTPADTCTLCSIRYDAKGRIILTSSGSAANLVTSVFGRAAVVTAQTGDYTAAQVTNSVSTLGSYTNPSWLVSIPWTKITATPTTLSAYNISDGVSTGGSYSNPSWITSLAWSKISSTPTTLSAYGIADAIKNLGNSTGFAAGLYSARPFPSNTKSYYFATDSNKIWYDNSAWILASSPGGIGDTTALMRKANNLGDVNNVSLARSNLGLGTAATKDIPASGNASTTQVVYGTDTRLTHTLSSNPAPAFVTLGITGGTGVNVLPFTGTNSGVATPAAFNQLDSLHRYSDSIRLFVKATTDSVFLEVTPITTGVPIQKFQFEINQASAGITQGHGDANFGPGTGNVVVTFPNINSNVGSFGDATHIPIPTVNSKGQVTAVNLVAIAGAITNLGQVVTTSQITLTSSTGSPVVLLTGSETAAGLISAALVKRIDSSVVIDNVGGALSDSIAYAKFSGISGVPDTLALRGRQDIQGLGILVTDGSNQGTIIKTYSINTAVVEQVSNKSNSSALGNSTSLYPTQNAVKLYADAILAGIPASSMVFTNKTISGASNTFTNINLSTSMIGLLSTGLGGTGVGGTLAGYVFANAGSPMTASNTIPGSAIAGNISGFSVNITGIGAISNGGTGANNAPAALVNLGAAPIVAPTFSGVVTLGANPSVHDSSLKAAPTIYVDRAVASIASASYTFTSGLTNTSGTITNDLITGKSGSQVITGGTGASETLTLRSTTNATKGKILLGANGAYDEANKLLGIGTASPTYSVDVQDNIASGGVLLSVSNANAGSTGFSGVRVYNDNAPGYLLRYSSGYGTTNLQNALVVQNTAGAPVVLFSGSEILRALANGTVGIGVVTPTAWLHLPSSTTAFASLRLPAGTAPTSPNHGELWTDASHIFARLAGVTYQIDQQASQNIGNTNLTLTGARALAGANNSLSLGTNASGLASFSIYSNSMLQLYGTPQYRPNASVSDANFSASQGYAVWTLPVITANRTFTLPNPAAGQGNTEITLWDINTSGFAWQVSPSIKDAAGNTVSSFDNGTVYDLMYDDNTSTWVIKNTNNGNSAPTNGTYTPTSTAITSVSSTTGGKSNWLKVGNQVYVWGYVSITPSSSSAACGIELTLPIASTFVNTRDCTGNFSSENGASYGNITGNSVGGNKASFGFLSGNTNTSDFSYTFSYTIH